MKILLTGAAGMLASEVIRVFEEDHELICYDINQRLPDIHALDITNAALTRSTIEAVNPDFVFHLAAETNVDLCEQKPDHAYKVNTYGTENIALACSAIDCPLLYISTGGVFDGFNPDEYIEFDQPNPVNVYGRSKLEGERIVEKLLRRYFIVRAGWMVGGWELDKKFVFKIVNQLLEGKKQLKAVSDKWGSPTFTKDFADNLKPLIESERWGLYHLTNEGSTNRYDIAMKIVEYMGLSNEVEVIPVDSSEFPLPAPRAASERLRNYKLELAGLNQMPLWTESLKDYISMNTAKRV